MEDLKKVVNFLQPVVKSINKHHNQFYECDYFTVAPEDLLLDEESLSLVEFMTADKNLPEHFNGEIPLIYMRWGEETGASILLWLTSEYQKLLDPVAHMALIGAYESEEPIAIQLTHEYYQTTAGFGVFDRIQAGDWMYKHHDAKAREDYIFCKSLDFILEELGLNYIKNDYVHKPWEV
tara:strand:+ start:43 stop:579 length:537 start_codon:yes stop_codon:yes gene_type:complete